MRAISVFILIFLMLISAHCKCQTGANEKIWMTKSGDTTKTWESQVFHLGNGYFGASCYGIPEHEIFTLAEKSFWLGGPGDASENDYGIIPYKDKSILEEIKKATAEGNITRVDSLADIFKSTAYGAFSCVGKLNLNFENHTGKVEDYSRTLDLSKSICTIKYRVNQVNYVREYFCSYPNRVLAMRITADQPGSLGFTFGIDLMHKKRSPKTVVNEKNGTLEIFGNIDDNNRSYVVKMKIVPENGIIYKTGYQLGIKNSNSATLYYTVATNYVLTAPLYKGADPDAITTESIRRAVKMGYDKLREVHIQDYQKLYNRTKLMLENPVGDRLSLPTNERLKYYTERNNYDDMGLKELEFNFGKYLLISGSRPKTLVMGLSGNWNDRYEALWNGAVQLDMNSTQTYMFGNALNLSECQQPFIDWAKDKVISEKQVAKEYFGSNGWLSGMVGDIWGHAGILNANNLRFNSTGWIALILWEQFAFDRNIQYLKEIYPILKGASQFYLDDLVEYKNTKKYVTYGFNSAEHVSENGALAPNFQDIGFAAETFENTIEAARILDVDADFQKKLKKTKDRLMPYKVGKWGQFQEWVEDLDDPNCKHRHISHLLGLQPCHQINFIKNPELLNPVRKILLSRGDADYVALRHPEICNSNLFPSTCTHEGLNYDNYTSQVWCRSARICLWLRAFDGNHADKIYNDILRESTLENMLQFETREHYSDKELLTPWFPDGNLLSAGYVTEMLLQSQFNEIYLLPALPDSWGTGSLTGIRARGGFTVDVYWHSVKLVKAVIVADHSGICKIRYNGKITEVYLFRGKPYVFSQSS
jgi:alpha-L-fucosidase 2